MTHTEDKRETSPERADTNASAPGPQEGSPTVASTNRAVVVIGVLLLAVLIGALVWKSRSQSAPASPSLLDAADAAKAKPRRPGPKRRLGPRAQRPRVPAIAPQNAVKAQQEMVERARQLYAAPVLSPDQRSPHVYMIVMDTLRADYSTPYGAKNDTTPLMQALAKDGILFKNVTSTASWTAPSMISMFTGLYPREHGVTDGMLVRKRGRVTGQQILPDEAQTLTESFQSAGYTTFGICSNYHLNQKFGFSQGFDFFVGEEFSFLPMPELGTMALAPNVRRSEKAFVWFHYLDPHFPYMPEPPYFGRWNDTRFNSLTDMSVELIARYYWEKANLPIGAPLPLTHVDRAAKLARQLNMGLPAMAWAISHFNAPDGSDYHRLLQAAYASEIREADDAATRALKAVGATDKDMIIYIADHGEELGDHGWWGHRHSMNQEMLHVPFVIRLPGKKGAGTVIEDPVSLVDVMPTILEAMGLPIPEGVTGRSLMPLVEGQTLPPRPMFAETKFHQQDMRTLIEYPWKYTRDFKQGTEELFNLETDPDERANLLNKESSRAAKMRKALTEWSESTQPRWEGESAPLSPLEIKRLQAMGYMHGGGAEPPGPKRPAPPAPGEDK